MSYFSDQNSFRFMSREFCSHSWRILKSSASRMWLKFCSHFLITSEVNRILLALWREFWSEKKLTLPHGAIVLWGFWMNFYEIKSTEWQFKRILFKSFIFSILHSKKNRNWINFFLMKDQRTIWVSLTTPYVWVQTRILHGISMQKI